MRTILLSAATLSALLSVPAFAASPATDAAQTTQQTTATGKAQEKNQQASNGKTAQQNTTVQASNAQINPSSQNPQEAQGSLTLQNNSNKKLSIASISSPIADSVSVQKFDNTQNKMQQNQGEATAANDSGMQDKTAGQNQNQGQSPINAMMADAKSAASNATNAVKDAATTATNTVKDAAKDTKNAMSNAWNSKNNLELNAKQSVELSEKSGNVLMFKGLKQPLQAGQQVAVNVKFSDGSTQNINFTVAQNNQGNQNGQGNQGKPSEQPEVTTQN